MKKQFDPHMHTAEHILNQTMVKMFGISRCFSAHIEKKKSKCDYRMPRDPGDAVLSRVAEAVNRVIAADLPVDAVSVDRSTAAWRFHLDRLPADVGDSIRIVRVGDFDACPCIGTHVRSTGEIGRFRITTATFRDGVLRIRFKLGRA